MTTGRRLTENIDGKIYGDLTVLGIREYRRSCGKSKIYEKVRCKCGKEYFTRREHIMGGRITNCGCKRNVMIRNVGIGNKTHGLYKSSFFAKYNGIIQRCTNKNSSSYKNYGGRGIACEWKSFDEFKKDMYDEYISSVSINGEKNTTIDRIDNNGNYSKNNCRWATFKEQERNKRNNRLVEYRGEMKTISELEELSFGKRIVYDRLKRGWDIEDAVNKPPMKLKKINR